jgi:hypothetical protein
LNTDRQEPKVIRVAREDHALRAQFALRMGLSPDLLQGIVLFADGRVMCTGQWALWLILCSKPSFSFAAAQVVHLFLRSVPQLGLKSPGTS